MKNKKSLYILIPLVIVVWGLIIVRVVKMTRSDDIVFSETSYHFQKKDTLIFPELKKLKLNYSDPFLKAQKAADSDGENSGFGNVFFNNPEPKKAGIKWPEVTYKGRIENGKALLGILEVEKQRHLVSKNQEINELKVNRIYADSIIISIKDEKKTFYK